MKYERRLRHAISALEAGRLADARSKLVALFSEGRPVAAWATLLLVTSYWQRGQAGKGEENLEKHLSEDDPLLAWGLGYLFRRLGRRAEAEALLARAASGNEGVGAAALELTILRSSAWRPARTLRSLFNLERRFVESRDRWGVAVVASERARLAVEVGAFEEAIVLCDRAARLRIGCGDRVGIGFVIQTEAKARHLMGDFTGAITCWRQALVAHERVGNHLDAGVILNNVGLWHLDLKSPERAAEAFTGAIRLFRRNRDEWRQAAALTNLGGANHLLGKRAASERDYARSLALLERVGAKAEFVAITRAELAEARVDDGRPGSTLAALAPVAGRRTSGLSPRTSALVAGEVARAHLALGDTKAAVVAARDAVRQANRGRASRHAKLGAIVRANAIRGRAVLRSGDPASARRILRGTLRDIDSLLKAQPDASVRVGLGEAHRAAADALIDALLPSRSGLGKALECLAGRKARELQRSDGVVPQRSTKRLEAAIRDLMGLSALTHTQKRRLRELRADFVDRPRPVVRETTLSIDGSTSILTASRCLGTSAAMIDFHVTATTARAFVACDGEIQLVDLGIGERALAGDLASLLGSLRTVATATDTGSALVGFDLELARRLYKRLIEPVMLVLPSSVRRWVVIPDGPLHGLPFEILVARLPPRRSVASPTLRRFDDAEYVGDRLIVSYVHSSSLLDLAPVRRKRANLLALAYSPPPGSRLQTPDGALPLSPLPASAREAASIAEFHGQAVVFQANRATVKAYRANAKRAGIIHIAAHAIADSSAPGLSGIVLASSRGSGLDFLTAEQIEQIPLTARLVVLSACESAGGRLKSREGLLGLARAFFVAGASAVLASLWPVDDEATCQLMVELHRGLAHGLEPAVALTRGKRILRSQVDRHLFALRAHPFFWGSFVLIDRKPGTLSASVGSAVAGSRV